MADYNISALIKTEKFRRSLLFVVMAAITLAIIYLLLSLVDVEKIINEIASISIGYLLAILFLEGAILLLVARRYQAILGHMGSRIRYKRCLAVNMATYPLIAVTPSISGNFIKVFYLRNESSPAIVAGSVVTERLFDMTALMGLVLLGLIFNFNLTLLLIIIALIIMGAAFIFVTGWAGGKFKWLIFRKLDEAIRIITGLFRDPRAMLSVTLYSLAIWSIALLQIYLFFMALNASVPFLSVIFKMPIAMLVGQIPVTIGGMGTRDGTMMQLFAGTVSFEQTLAVGFLFSIVRYWLPAALGIFFMLYENGVSISKKEAGH